MLVTDNEMDMCGKRSAASGSGIGSGGCAELYARSANFNRGGHGTDALQDNEKGGDGMNGEKTVVRRLTPL